MSYHLTVLARDAAIEKHWAGELGFALRGLTGGTPLRVECAAAAGLQGQLLFVDGALPDLAARLDRLERGGKAVFLVIDEKGALPQALVDGKCDDVLVHPFRPLEILSKLRHYHQILMWEEVSRMNQSFSQLLERLHDDLRVAERLQKSNAPVRFPEVKGFKVTHRYLAGMKSGGDHFDIAQSRDGSAISIVLSDSSTYGLSSAILSVLMKVAVKLTIEETRSSLDTVNRIQDELLLALGQKDRLALFYGVISRKDLALRYVNLGSSMGFYAPVEGQFRVLESRPDPITQGAAPVLGAETVLPLEPGARLVFLSDGFVEAAGGVKETVGLLDRFRGKEALDCTNELVYRVKSAFVEEDDMPAQDCTAAIMDIDSRVIRLAPG